jgi:plastocyanin
MNQGGTFDFQFNSSGSFPYHCAFHITMTGTVNVNAPNVPPNLSVPGPQSVVVPAQSVNFNVSATDGNPQDTVTITLLGLNPTPSNTTPTFTGTNPKTFNWSPICIEAGTYYAKFQANDGKGGIDTDSVLITVQCTIHYILLDSLKFKPQVETVGVGEQVCWIHIDPLCPSPCFHTTTSDSGVWNSDTMFTNDTFCFIFNNPGVYPYHCIPHQIDGMVGTILACSAIPGDANASGNLTLGDIIATVNYIFNKAGCIPTPSCWLSGLLCRGDWNGSGTVSLSDVIRGVNYIFNKPGGPWNPVPIGACCFSP